MRSLFAFLASLLFLSLFLSSPFVWGEEEVGATEREKKKTTTIREEFKELVEGRAIPPSCRPSLNPAECPGDLNGIISSPGGTGSTHVLRQARSDGLFVNIAGNSDKIKHTPFPPLHNRTLRTKEKRWREGRTVDYDLFKGVYVFGDPLEGLISLFRRRYEWKQVRATTKGSCRLPHFKKKKTAEKVPKFLSGYTSIAEHDWLRLNEHYIHWIFDETPYDRIFINGAFSVDTLEAFPFRSLFSFSFSSLRPHPELLDTLGFVAKNKSQDIGDLVWKMKNSKKVVTFTHPHVRSSAKFNMSQSVTDLLRSPYVAVDAFLKQLPPIFVRPGNNKEFYDVARASTFSEKLSHKFMGDFDVDEILDSVLP